MLLPRNLFLSMFILSAYPSVLSQKCFHLILTNYYLLHAASTSSLVMIRSESKHLPKLGIYPPLSVARSEFLDARLDTLWQPLLRLRRDLADHASYLLNKSKNLSFLFDRVSLLDR
jgi:hypothetical protein